MSEYRISLDDFEVLKKRNIKIHWNISANCDEFHCGSKFIKLRIKESGMSTVLGISKREDKVSTMSRVNEYAKVWNAT